MTGHNGIILAVIPARGGSKGVPRKNIRLLGGKPLIFHTIEAALGSDKIDRIIVSTDDNEIAVIAKESGAEVVLRPAELATDIAATEPVLEHTLGYLKETEGYIADIIILLQPTSPLRTSYHVNEALNTFFTGEYDSLLSVCPSHYFLWRVEGEIAYPLNYDIKNRPLRQKREPEYRENGAIFITKRNILLEGHNRLGGKIGLYMMAEEDSIEIDSEFDLKACELLGQKRWEKRY